MRELSITEVQAVSGAGRVQDKLTEAYGWFFSHAANTLNNLFDLGYDKEAAQKKGEEFGSQLGKAMEVKFANFLERIQNYVTG